MENPLDLPAPSEDKRIERIHSMARDIAYGALNNMWTPHLRVKNAQGPGIFDDAGLNKGLKPKWGDSHNSYAVHLLVSFGYLAVSQEPWKEPGITFYDVSQKAFSLLEKPFTPPSVFISYKQDQSSDLALLIEARLKLVDNNINIFIDKLLQPGDDWETRLEETVRNSRYFICLLTSNSLKSKAVQAEIQWAYEANCTMIAICHNGYEINEQYPTQLKGKQAIIIRHKNAKEYESAINDLLNSMNYSTI